ncbi:hypothetical protein Csp2054_10435 [Curtobacterium sp. 'Ferrero']|uniref:hypothetical protein n=1 Tax=Curtobacterium sp. 'Ferrero' TaxID=2033654 RepID=UPI000BCF618A|nr:hypothetical protein [Curtobacterium sp. 'Ferrero']PCN47780.1 hypothetical protein Csp2054_10435 [Curtobacterium sp. 'Ferrero']
MAPTKDFHGTALAASAGAALLAAVALAGCAPVTAADPTAAPPSGSASATTTGSEGSGSGATGTGGTGTGTTSPRPTSTITPVPGVDDDRGHLPDTCTGLITAGRWDDSFAAMPLNDPTVVGDPVEVPKDALTPVLQPDGTSLYCVWRDPRADITFLSIRVAVVDSTKTYAHLQSALDGYDCAHDGYGYRCQRISQDSQYPVTDGDTYSTRGDVGIHIQQANIPTSGLLDDVIAHVF